MGLSGSSCEAKETIRSAENAVPAEKTFPPLQSDLFGSILSRKGQTICVWKLADCQPRLNQEDTQNEGNNED